MDSVMSGAMALVFFLQIAGLLVLLVLAGYFWLRSVRSGSSNKGLPPLPYDDALSAANYYELEDQRFRERVVRDDALRAGAMAEQQRIEDAEMARRLGL